ncbi:MAG: hypothetical protein HQL69_09460 [Magnetococcales bacterium]|nr:hypothetical protein [Magnetococcales bacterium]
MFDTENPTMGVFNISLIMIFLLWACPIGLYYLTGATVVMGVRLDVLLPLVYLFWATQFITNSVQEASDKVYQLGPIEAERENKFELRGRMGIIGGSILGITFAMLGTAYVLPKYYFDPVLHLPNRLSIIALFVVLGFATSKIWSICCNTKTYDDNHNHGPERKSWSLVDMFKPKETH